MKVLIFNVILISSLISSSMLFTSQHPSSEQLATVNDKTAYPAYYKTIQSLESNQLGANGDTKLSIGSPAPDFRFAMDGQVATVRSMLGKPVMINIFASWCPPCHVEMPTIKDAYEKYKDDGLVIVAVSMDSDIKDAKYFYKQYNLSLPFVPGGEPGTSIGNQYQIEYIPTSIFVDRKGNVVELMIGGLEPSALEEKLAKIL